MCLIFAVDPLPARALRAAGELAQGAGVAEAVPAARAGGLREPRARPRATHAPRAPRAPRRAAPPAPPTRQKAIQVTTQSWQYVFLTNYKSY